MKAEKKQELALWALCAAIVVTFFASLYYVKKAEWTEIVTGSIIAKSDDTVKSGKYSQRSRFLFAMQYENRPSDTIEVELHTFVTKRVGDRYAYYVRHRADRGWEAGAAFAMIATGVIIVMAAIVMAGAAFSAWIRKDD